MGNRSGSTLKSFLFGATIGAIAGILYAPEEGEKTRKKLKKNLDESKGKLQEAGDVAKEKAEEIKKGASEEFNTLREKVEEKSQEVTKDQPAEKKPRKKSSSRPRKFKGV